jgi:hypothetical protein
MIHFAPITQRSVILSGAKDLCTLPAAPKIRRVPENAAQVPPRGTFFIVENAPGTAKQDERRYDPSHALSDIGAGPGILLKLRYLRRSLMFTGRKLALTLAFTVLVAMALGVGCRGFFQGNALLSIAIQPPTPTVQLNQTQTLSAWGTYSNGNGGTTQITSGVAWSSDTPNVLSIDPNSGVATGQSLGTATVTASAQGLSATASATVYILVTTLKVTPNTWSFSGAQGGTNPVGFVVTANGGTDVTSTAIFTSSNTTYINCVNSTDPVFCTAIPSTPPGPYQIVVSYPQTNLTALITVTAN